MDNEEMPLLPQLSEFLLRHGAELAGIANTVANWLNGRPNEIDRLTYNPDGTPRG